MVDDDALRDPKWDNPMTTMDPAAKEEVDGITYAWMLSHTRAEAWEAARTAHAMLAPLNNGMDVWGDENFKWWQVFTGDTLHGERFRRSVAIEPMTCPPDSFRSGRDLLVLEPGQTWSASWGIKP